VTTGVNNLRCVPNICFVYETNDRMNERASELLNERINDGRIEITTTGDGDVVSFSALLS